MGDAILVVDDEHNFCTGIRFFLEENGYAVDLAASGSQALGCLRKRSYQAVLLDLILPDIEGIELAEYITLHQPEAAIVILTGHATMDTAIRAIRYGVVDYLQKPCRPEIVLQIISRGIETRRLKKELVVSRKKFEQLASATWEGIAFFTCETVAQHNQQFCELFDLAATSTATLELHQIVEDWQKCLSLLANCPEGQPAVLETMGIYSDGTTFPMEMRIRKISTSENGEFVWVAAFRDISARKREEISRLQMQEELANAQRMEAIGMMAGSVAHDLNNILTSIVTFPELLLMQMPSTARYREDINKIRKAGKQAANVVDDLLTVVRGATCEKKPHNLNQLLNNYRHSLDFDQIKREYPEINVVFQPQPNLAHIEASPLHISKSIINLVINAVEAIGQQGTVSITTENRSLQKMYNGYEAIPPGSYVVLSVLDNGPGISRKDLKHIFEPFFSKKELGRSGTGLGLTVIWNTVRDHHGYIDILSSSRGSCFELYFPVCFEAEHSQQLDDSSLPPEGKGEKVLVIDDEIMQLEVTASLLNRLGYTAVTAPNGETAIEYLKEQPVDLLLLDLWMEPGIDGYETYRRVLEIRPNLKAIVTSGYFRPEDQEIAQSLGIRKHLTKPYSISNLATALKDEIHG